VIAVCVGIWGNLGSELCGIQCIMEMALRHALSFAETSELALDF